MLSKWEKKLIFWSLCTLVILATLAERVVFFSRALQHNYENQAAAIEFIEANCKDPVTIVKRKVAKECHTREHDAEMMPITGALAQTLAPVGLGGIASAADSFMGFFFLLIVGISGFVALNILNKKGRTKAGALMPLRKGEIVKKNA